MDLIISLKSILKNLKNDDAFLSPESKERYVAEEIIAYMKSYQLAEASDNIKFDYKFESKTHSNHCQNYLDSLIKEKISKEVVIKSVEENTIYTSGKNTKKAQREKLVLSMKNLCHYLGIKKVDSFFSNDGQTYYRPEGFSEFQSASNVIVDLSYLIASKEINNQV